MAEAPDASFQDMELDERLLKAIARMGWADPTPVQEAAIPLLLQGRDVLIKARTGSGKTGAFAVPAIQKVLLSKRTAREQLTRVLILAPFRELCGQIAEHVSQLASKCSREVICVDISPPLELSAQKPLLSSRPDIVVATPTRALQHLKAGHLIMTGLELLVVDEADLVLSFGHGDDLRELLSELPKSRQTALASATLAPELAELRKIALRRPAILRLEEPEVAPPSQLSHFHVGAEEEEKAVILLVLLKLGLVRGRTLIFVNTVDRCYKLKLFLEQFALPACVLNSELPAAARCHAVSQFNQGLFDLLIASEERDLESPGEEASKDEADTEATSTKKKEKGGSKGKQAKGKGKRVKDQEAGVSRGIDFQFVSNVINFDFPTDVNRYIHRVGRTARGKNQGTALSLVSIVERPLLASVEEHLRTAAGGSEDVIRPFQFKMEEVEGFRYRARDAWRAVTRIAVREARLKEIRLEVLNCDKLSAFFEQHPRDLASLRHDRALHAVKKQPHLAHVPDYIIPRSLKRLAGPSRRRPRLGADASAGADHSKAGGSRAHAKFMARQKNPLLSMEFSGFAKKKKKK